MFKVTGTASDCAQKLSEIISSISETKKTQIRYKARLQKVRDQLTDASAAVDYGTLLTPISMAFPAFSGENLKKLRQVCTFCLGQVLLQETKDKVKLVQGSFVPTEDDLEFITTTGGKKMSTEEFVQIQHILSERFEND
jgi:hypothetical protein